MSCYVPRMHSMAEQPKNVLIMTYLYIFVKQNLRLRYSKYVTFIILTHHMNMQGWKISNFTKMLDNIPSNLFHVIEWDQPFTIKNQLIFVYHISITAFFFLQIRRKATLIDLPATFISLVAKKGDNISLILCLNRQW